MNNSECNIVFRITAIKTTVGREYRAASAIDSGASSVYLLDHIILPVSNIYLNWPILFNYIKSTKRVRISRTEISQIDVTLRIYISRAHTTQIPHASLQFPASV